VERMIRPRSMWCAMLFVACALTTTPCEAQTSFRLVEQQRYGWEDVGEATRTLTPNERRLSAGMIGGATEIVEGRGRLLYVLDARLKKVVVFRPDGSFHRVIGNGPGRGPGEMERPRSVAVAPNGTVFVLDQALARIEAFDSAGVPRRTIT